MARISLSSMIKWKDQDVMKATDYVRERDLLVTAINLTDDDYASSADLEAGLLANKNDDHLGTWRGLTPEDISIGLAITPEQIGAASQEDLDALSAEVSKIKSLRYNMSDFPVIVPEADDTARIQRAITALPDGAELTFPNDEYVISSGIDISKSVSIRFEGKAKILNNSNDNCFTIMGDQEDVAYTLPLLTRGMKDINLVEHPEGYKQGDMVLLTETPTSNNMETHEVLSVTMTGTNLVTNPSMGTDSNADGVVDSFTSFTATGATATFSLDSAQKINLTASTEPTNASVSQASIPVVAGTAYSLLVDAMVENPISTFKGQIEMSFLNASDAVLGTTTKDFTNDTFQSIELHNLIAPVGATKATITFRAVAATAGDTGSTLFKNVQLKTSATKVTLRDYVRANKAVGGSIAKVLPVEKVKFTDFRYQMYEGAEGAAGIYIGNARDITIDGVSTTRHPEPAVMLEIVLGAVVTRVNASNPQMGVNAGIPIAIDKGSSRVTIKDCTLEGGQCGIFIGTAHDYILDNVTVMNTTLAGIYANYYGYSNDVTVINCKLIDVPFGIRVEAIDFSNPISSNVTLFNYSFSNLLIRLNLGSGIGIYTKTAFKEKGISIDSVDVKYLSGAEGNYDGLTNFGLQILPGKTKANITNCTFEGMYAAIRLSTNNTTTVTNDGSNIVIRDVTCRNLRGAIDIVRGEAINLLIYNLLCDNLTTCVFNNYSANAQTYTQLVINGMSVVNSPAASWWFKTPVPTTGNSIRGVIHNIRTDRTSGVAPIASYNLSLEDIFFTLDGQTLYLRGTAVASNTTGKIFPDGLVDGQMLKVLVQSGSWVINKGTNIFFRTNAASITLATTGTPVASFVWMTKGTPGWYQIS